MPHNDSYRSENMILIQYSRHTDTLHARSKMGTYEGNQNNIQNIEYLFYKRKGNAFIIGFTITNVKELNQTKWEASNEVVEVPQMFFDAVSKWLKARDIDGIIMIDARFPGVPKAGH